MSVAVADPAKHEILIIKRHGGDHEDGHHGGAWKIAFADFMTAMMCFFLVMWLINAANEQTKASVASYFNPVKLIDRNSSRKGLEDIGDGPNAVGTDTEVPEEPKEQAGTEGQGRSGPSENAESQEQTESETRSDEHLFADPYAVLAEIAAETGKLQNVSAKGDGGAQDSGPATGADGGESYRDPFAPDFWSQQVTAPEEAVAIVDESVSARSPASEPATEPVEDIAAETVVEAIETAAIEKVEPAVETAEPDVAKAGPSAESPPVPPEEALPAEAEKPTPGETEATPEAIAAAEKIRDQLNAAFAGEGLADNVAVTVKDSTIIVAVTDELDFGMFEIGSALPRRELVLAMEKIGRIVSAQPGEVEINGHTDARPFKSGDYDNWRLSSARAHAAYYMLVRGGLEEARVKQVSGLADRRLKLPEDPLGAGNRRIEILIETRP